MNYESAAEKYVKLRTEVERIEREAKTKTAELKSVMLDLENWITLRAQEDGLENVKTACGTAYWSTHYSAKCASRDALFEYCKTTGEWDLLEARPSKLAVKAHVAGHGTPPPGVDFSAIKVFNLRMSIKE